MLTITKRQAKIGPEDHGRKMSLKAFEFAQTEEGYHCELSRGYIIVSEVANYQKKRTGTNGTSMRAF